MEDRLIEILNEINDQVDYASEEALIDDGLINSLDLMELISEIEAEWDLSLGMEEIIPEHFNSIAGMAGMIERLTAK